MKKLFIYLILCLYLPELRAQDFKEGLVVKLSKEELESFIPWANNTRVILKETLKEIKSMPLREQVSYMKEQVKNVVKLSGKKRTQSFMRITLNRAVYFSDLVVKETKVENFKNKKRSVIITKRNQRYLAQVKILASGIETALKLYQFDLDFQKTKEVKKSNDHLYAKSAALIFKNNYLNAKHFISDVSAQYLVLYHSLDMLKYDLAQDEKANDLADSILKIHRQLKALPSHGRNSDVKNQENIRKLYLLIESLSYSFTKLGIIEMIKKEDYLKEMHFVEIPKGLLIFKGDTYEIENSFKMMTTEVTQLMYYKVMKESPSSNGYTCEGETKVKLKFGNFKNICPYNPVTDITLAQIDSFIKKLEAKTGIKTRLPTYEEWLWAAAGSDVSSLTGSDYADAKAPIAVGVKNEFSKANGYGLYNMFDNISEMTNSQYIQNRGAWARVDDILRDKRSSNGNILAGCNYYYIYRNYRCDKSYAEPEAEVPAFVRGFRLIRMN